MKENIKTLVEMYIDSLNENRLKNEYHDGRSNGLYSALCVVTGNNQELIEFVKQEIKKLQSK